MNRAPTSTTERDLVPPIISAVLIDYLRGAFPNDLPSNIMTISERELGALHGEQRVIEHLVGLLVSQQEEDQLPHVLGT